jgi:hypothetical protein
VLDITLKSPLTDTGLSNKSAPVQRAVATDGYNSKNLKHSTLCTHNGFDFYRYLSSRLVHVVYNFCSQQTF